MDVVVRSKNVEVTPRLRTIAERKLAHVVRLVRDPVRAEVDFSEERNPRIADAYVCSVSIHFRRAYLNAHAAASQPDAALDAALEKLEHRVARIKDRRLSRLHPRRLRAARRRRTPEA